MATTFGIKKDQVLFEKQLEAHIAEIDESFFFLDSHYNFIYLNAAAERLLGRDKGELIGKNIWEVLPIEKNVSLFNILLRTLEGERKIKTNFYSVMYERWFHLSMFSTDQNVSIQLGDVEEIQEDKLRFHNLSFDPLALETFLDNIPHIVFAASNAGTTIYFNKRWAEYTGDRWNGEVEEIWKTVIHPDDYKRVVNLWFETSHLGVPFEAEYRIRDYKGEYRWHLGRSVPIKSSDGTTNYWIGTVTDVQALKETQDMLKQSERFAQTLIANSPGMILITNHLDNTNTYRNKVIEEVLGYDEEILRKPVDQFIIDYVHPDDQNDVNQFLQLVLSNRDDDMVYDTEMRVLDVYGNWHWLQTRAKVFSRTETGDVKDILYYMSDITSLKETELKLKESINFRNKIADASLDLITVLDYSTLKFTYVNRLPSYSRFGMEELINAPLQHIKKIVHPGDQPRFLKYFQRFNEASDDEVLECEYRMVNSKEDWRWVCSRGKVFERDKQGMPAKLLIVTQDITARKNVDSAARQNVLMQKLLEKKDEFMSIASHELKTPITTMKASIQILQRLVDNQTDPKVLKVFISKANEQINRLTTLINDLLDNARIQAGKVALRISKFKIAEVIEECIIHDANKHKIVVENVVDDFVEGDKIRISQVLTNFITNAVKYSPQSDRVVIDTQKEDGFLKVSVTDFGIGIPKEKVDKVFDRFFRVEETSSEFSGLGLGLYISAEIIKRHHGQYGVTSEQGKGSTFWFKIPIKAIV